MIVRALFDGAGEGAILLIRLGLGYMVVRGAWKLTAKELAESASPLKTSAQALLIVVGFAAVLALMKGSPSCIESDPVHGGCLEYEDPSDSPPVTGGDQWSHFGSMLVLFGSPTLYAIGSHWSDMREKRKAIASASQP